MVSMSQTALTSIDSVRTTILHRKKTSQRLINSEHQLKLRWNTSLLIKTRNSNAQRKYGRVSSIRNKSHRRQRKVCRRPISILSSISITQLIKRKSYLNARLILSQLKKWTNLIFEWWFLTLAGLQLIMKKLSISLLYSASQITFCSNIRL